MPREAEIPTREELAKLPCWASVAFAARCARRIQPLFARWRGATTEQIDAVEHAITVAENAAAAADSARAADYAGRSAAAAAAHYAAAADSARAAADSAGRAADAAAAHYAAADYAAAAARAADYAAAAARAADSAAAARVVAARAADSAAAAHVVAAAAALAATREAMRFDFELLRTAAKREQWTDDTPVPPEFFGPIWPFGAPEGWPNSEHQKPSSDPHVLRLEFSIPSALDRDEADRLIGDIIQRANELHHAYGGQGISIADGKVFECEPALVPAGGDR